MPVKSDFELAQEFAQYVLSLTPVIILGSGASAAHGVPGMVPLADHLKAAPTPSWSAKEQGEWARFREALDGGIDLEAALGDVRFSDEQTDFVARVTRDFLLPSDRAVFAQVLANQQVLPLSRLFRHLFSSTHRTIDVVTPNYDRIAEYAADAAGFAYFNAFTQGYFQARQDPAARLAIKGQEVRTVCIWKVHGSLDWFREPSGQIFGAPSLEVTPNGCVPMMVTPGIEKYRRTYDEPFRTIFGCSDAALVKARAYFCVGFGFNDAHMQQKLVERCQEHSVPIVIITKALSDAAKKFLRADRCRRYLALEEAPGGTRVFTNDQPEGAILTGCHAWRFDAFLDMTLLGGVA